ncbi:MAG: hypothetical protein A2X56_13420 [Nitrospirae bacterium GWC2_57_13]|nr:MAG: hypothetical protein A2X56_13420 [Nitrospirae bacterium GWC2_57_13]HAR44743.1 hypothetical protein [Nitrospiraceae bacterium]
MKNLLRAAMTAVVLLGLVPSLAQAAEEPVWVEAVGEAQMGEYDTQKEVKERAKRDAQQKAVEKAVGAFIRSHTFVSNNQIADDLVYASVRGKVEKAEILSEGWNQKDRNLYRVALKALVTPVYPERGEGLSIKVSLSRTLLKEGEDVRIFYQANSDCHVYLFSVAADGSVTLLLPNAQDRDNFVKGGTAVEFPSTGNPLRLEARFLPGFIGKSAEERVKIIATKNKEDIIALGFREGMFEAFDAKSTGMISDLVRRLNQLEPADWAEATAVYQINR